MLDIVSPEIKTPKVTLLSWTKLPLETLYAVWEASKTERPLRTPEQIQAEVPPAEVAKLFMDVIKQGIPIGEHLNFVFMMEHVSVSWREHAVRHRIGVCPSPERLGADIVMTVDTIPDRPNSSFWSQSARILDMGSFADKGDYRVPQSLVEHPDGAILVERWRNHMKATQGIYREFTEAGIPMEDAREAIPIAMQHRMSWSLNVQSLRHILTERGCWILQLGVWGPIIEGMVSELVSKVHPIFSMLVTPPCLTGSGNRETMVNRFVEAFVAKAESGVQDTAEVQRHARALAASNAVEFTSWVDTQPPPEWVGCRFELENARRYTGEDRLPPCSLHYTYHATGEQREAVHAGSGEMCRAIGEHAVKRERFWGRQPWTGHRHLPVVTG